MNRPPATGTDRGERLRRLRLTGPDLFRDQEASPVIEALANSLAFPSLSLEDIARFITMAETRDFATINREFLRVQGTSDQPG